MKMIIEIDEDIITAIKENRIVPKQLYTLFDSVVNGTPIPDNATNGEVIRAIFPDGVKTSIAYPRDVSKEWINAPYQKGGKG